MKKTYSKPNILDILRQLIKMGIAVIIALFILSVFSFFYYNNGIRKTTTTGATDYTWENSFWSIGYEGFSFGFFDDNGFNNKNGTDEDVDILLMGSSQMLANNVCQKYSVGYILNSLFSTTPNKYNLYNIGMEGHDIYMCVDNFTDAVNTFSPSKYVIIQTSKIDLNIDLMQEVINGKRKRSPAYDEGIIYYLQKIPYFRLLHRQIRDMHGELEVIEKQNVKTNYSVSDAKNDKKYCTILNEFLSILSNDSIHVIILYNPKTSITTDGNISTDVNDSDIDYFCDCCNDLGIGFINLSDSFIKHYNETRELPYGFSNSQIGTGHLNRIGHKIIAEKIFEYICELEAAK